DEILCERVKQRKREVVVVILTVDGVLGEVEKRVMHPAHIPFQAEAQPAEVGGARNSTPGGGFLGNRQDTRMVLVREFVKPLEEVNGIQVLVSSILVRDPFARFAGIVQV